AATPGGSPSTSPGVEAALTGRTPDHLSSVDAVTISTGETRFVLGCQSKALKALKALNVFGGPEEIGPGWCWPSPGVAGSPRLPVQGGQEGQRHSRPEWAPWPSWHGRSPGGVRRQCRTKKCPGRHSAWNACR